jgi:hypothetical protein
MPTPEQPPEVLGRFCHGDLDAFGRYFAGIRTRFTGGSYGSFAIPRLPRTSPSKPSGASIGRMPGSTLGGLSGRGHGESRLTPHLIV